MRTTSSRASFTSSLAVVVLVAGEAHADKLGDLLFDVAAQRDFTRAAARSVLGLRVRQRVPDEVEPSLVPFMPGFAVCVSGPERSHILTAGPLATAAALVDIQSPTGRWVRVASVVPLGDGALAELIAPDFLLWAELRPVSVAEETKLVRTTPVFAVDGPGTPHAFLVKGVVIETLDDSLAGLFVNDVRFPHGTPLLSVDRTLLGVNYRTPSATMDGRSVAVSAELIRAWLRPKGPADGASP